jgi:hypothetical protein
MRTMTQRTLHIDRGLILRLIGAALLLCGLLVAFLGPVELYTFYLFSEGGRFHYEGFRFGSFMFGNLAAQILGYYFIAAALIPLGYGTFKLRSWACHLTLAWLRFWAVAGLPLITAFFFVLLSSKELALPLVILVGLLLVFSYLALPGFAVRFYQHPATRRHFEQGESRRSWIESLPVPLLGLSLVFVFFILVLHVQIFFNGIFPLFGRWVNGLDGIVLIDVSILVLILLTVGVLHAKPWAWWAAMAYFGLMTASYTVTLLSSTWMEILSSLNLPAFEMRILQGVPLQGGHFAIMVGIPFLLTLRLTSGTRPYFRSQEL